MLAPGSAGVGSHCYGGVDRLPDSPEYAGLPDAPGGRYEQVSPQGGRDRPYRRASRFKHAA